MNVVILDTGCANLNSVKSAVARHGYDPIVSRDADAAGEEPVLAAARARRILADLTCPFDRFAFTLVRCHDRHFSFG